MSLGRVEITQEVMITCLTHAFTCESEEIMGLLLGDILEESPGFTVSRIWMAYPQIRTDRRKDRVETSPEQMARCSAHAERLSHETGQRTRVVGWYHSHPHITVLPSHVDVRTQAMYQLLDPGFVGLIFSVFNSDASSKAGQIQVTAFQSVPSNHPLAAGSASNMNTELVSYSSEALAGLDTPTKLAIRASAEAMHEVNRDSMVRREAPLTVVPARNDLERGLHDLVVVHRILAMEEKEAFTATQQQLPATTITPQVTGSSTGSSSSPSLTPRLQPQPNLTSPNAASREQPPVMPPGAALAQLHAASCYQQQLSQMIETVLAPSLVGMSGLLNQHALQAAQLQAHNQELQALIQTRRQQQQQELAQQQQQRAAAQQGLGAALAAVGGAAGASAAAHPPQHEISFGNLSLTSDPPSSHSNDLPSNVSLTPHTHAHTFPRGTSPGLHPDAYNRSTSGFAAAHTAGTEATQPVGYNVQVPSPVKQQQATGAVAAPQSQGPLAAQIQAMLSPPGDGVPPGQQHTTTASQSPRQQQHQQQLYHTQMAGPGGVQPAAVGHQLSGGRHQGVEAAQAAAERAVREALPSSYPVMVDLQGQSQYGIPVASYAARNLHQGLPHRPSAPQGAPVDNMLAGQINLAGLPVIASASERMGALQPPKGSDGRTGE